MSSAPSPSPERVEVSAATVPHITQSDLQRWLRSRVSLAIFIALLVLWLAGLLLHRDAHGAVHLLLLAATLQLIARIAAQRR